MANKKKLFIRKDPRNGIHAIGGSVKIRFEGNQVYATNNKKEIEILTADPEVVEYTPEPTEEEIKIQEEKDEEKRQKEAEKEAKKKEEEVENDPGEDNLDLPPQD